MGLERVAEAIYRLLQREAQSQRQAGAVIREETIEAVLGDGWYRVGGERLAAKGSAVLRVGQRVHVLWQQGRRVLLLTHHWKRAQPGPTTVQAGGAAIEELIVGTITGGSIKARFGGAGNQSPSDEEGDIDLWFRNADQLVPLKLTAALLGLGAGWVSSGGNGAYVQWGTRDDTFMVWNGGDGGQTVLIYKLNREAGTSYPAGATVSASLLRSVPLPTIALGTVDALSFPADTPTLNRFLTEDVRLLGTTATGTFNAEPARVWVLDLDAGSILWQEDYAAVTNIGVSPEIMRWGATSADQWIIVTYQSFAGVPPFTMTLLVVTAGGSVLHAATTPTPPDADHFGSAISVRANEKWLTYALEVVESGSALDPPQSVTAIYYLVAPGAGPAIELGRETDAVYMNPTTDILYSQVAARLLYLIPLKGDLFYVIDEAATAADEDPDPHVGWLFNFASPLGWPPLTGTVGTRALSRTEREGVLTADALTSILSPLSPTKRAPLLLKDFPADFFPPFAWNANALRDNGAGFCAYHVVNDPAALGDLAAAAAR